MKDFKNLLIWQKSVELVIFVYKIIKAFTEEEKYGLVSQTRRSAVSIPSNISEGHMRTTNKDFRHFISIARGSYAELETQSVIAYKLGYIINKDYQLLISKIQEISKMLSSFYSKL